MTTEQMIGLGITLLVMLLGLIGSILPALPGTPLVFIAAIGHRLYFGENSVSNLMLGILAGLMILSLVLDFAASMLGAKKFGATWRGAVGAAVGGIIGLFFSLPGIILGPLIGAILLEMLGGREFKPAARAGVGAVIGLLLGVVGKFSIAVLMSILFAVNVVMRSGS